MKIVSLLASGLALVACSPISVPVSDGNVPSHYQIPDKTNCSLGEIKNGVQYVDCGAAYDGPAYYVDVETGVILGHCGGACMMGGCPKNQCPPPKWLDMS